MGEHLVGVQLHLHRLARPLRVPDHPGPPVAAHRLDRLAHRLGDREVLVRLRDPLDHAVSVAGERHVAEQQVKEPVVPEHAVQQEHDRLVDQVGGGLLDRLAVVIHVPRREVLERCERRPVLHRETVGDHAHHVAPERQRQLSHVRAGQLRVRGLQVVAAGAGLLQLDERQRHPVDVQHHVEPAPVLPVHHLHLARGHEVVVLDVPAVEQPDRRVLLRPVLVGVGDGPDAPGQELVHPLVLGRRVP